MILELVATHLVGNVAHVYMSMLYACISSLINDFIAIVLVMDKDKPPLVLNELRKGQGSEVGEGLCTKGGVENIYRVSYYNGTFRTELLTYLDFLVYQQNNNLEASSTSCMWHRL
ncbi:hypothetical protein ACJX0J_036094, partial [Zea mays]